MYILAVTNYCLAILQAYCRVLYSTHIRLESKTPGPYRQLHVGRVHITIVKNRTGINVIKIGSLLLRLLCTTLVEKGRLKLCTYISWSFYKDTLRILTLGRSSPYLCHPPRTHRQQQHSVSIPITSSCRYAEWVRQGIYIICCKVVVQAVYSESRYYKEKIRLSKWRRRGCTAQYIPVQKYDAEYRLAHLASFFPFLDYQPGIVGLAYPVKTRRHFIDLAAKELNTYLCFRGEFKMFGIYCWHNIMTKQIKSKHM